MRFRVLLLFALLAGSVALAKEPVTPAVAAVSPRTPEMGSVVWSPAGDRFVWRETPTVWIYNVTTGERYGLLNPTAMDAVAQEPPQPERFGWQNRRVRESTIQWFPDGERLLVKIKGDLFIFTIDGREWRQLTQTSEDEADPKLSPDGTKVSFRRSANLYVADVESGKVRRLTKSGSYDIGNGRLDWVYPEELDLGTAYWWSPDSTRIAYLQFDVSREAWYPHADLTGVVPVSEPQRFPRAGTPNPDVRLGVIRADGGRTEWLDSVNGDDELLARVAWTPDSQALLIQKLNRIQNHLALRYLPLDGRPRTVLEETDKAWVNVADDLYLFKNSPRLLWSSERTGFRQLYLYSLDGTLERQLTKGDWEVTEVGGVDEAAGLVYYLSTAATPLERRLYAVSLDGGAPRLLTPEAGVHSVSLAPDARHFIDSWSSMTTPTQRVLRDANGTAVDLLVAADRDVPSRYELLPEEVVEVKADDGATLYGRLIRPAGFEAGRKYPAVVLVYGGPHAQSILNSWDGADLAQALAQAGFVVWELDNRGSSGRGHAWEARLYRRFGEQELRDQVRGVSHLLSLGFVDPKRVGIHGWSYGGYMTIYSLLHAPETFRAGVAGAPVTDWRDYDTIYTERYLGLPSENEEGYRESSPVHDAASLESDLLILHNLEDDNVLFQHSMRMADALEQAGKQFQMVLYPQKTHHVTGKARAQMYQTIVGFFEKKLGEANDAGAR